MIARHWRGLARRDRADDDVEHLRSATFPALARLDGFIGAKIHRRAVGGGVEFLVITRRASLESIRAFAGPDTEVAVVPSSMQAMMVEFDADVRHHAVVACPSRSARPCRSSSASRFDGARFADLDGSILPA